MHTLILVAAIVAATLFLRRKIDMSNTALTEAVTQLKTDIGELAIRLETDRDVDAAVAELREMSAQVDALDPDALAEDAGTQTPGESGGEGTDNGDETPTA